MIQNESNGQVMERVYSRKVAQAVDGSFKSNAPCVPDKVFSANERMRHIGLLALGRLITIAQLLK